ncbi:MAG TPA: hypothetical protein V6C72_12790 [Chroococcales cyanobacterium]
MSYKTNPQRTVSLAAIALAATLSLQPAAKSDTTIATTEIMACGHLFSIDANADHKTAAERARIVQQNLDNALIAAKDRTPGAVQVGFQNNNPIVTLDHFYIVTADKNSAIRAGISQEELAERWASSIRHCLSDSSMVSKYVSTLTGKFASSERIAAKMNRTDVAVLPWGTDLPVAMKHDLNIADAMLGTPITVSLVTDVPLAPNYNTYLPAGTLALGELVNGAPQNPNNFAGHHALMAHFYALQTPDGKQIPISGHLLGGVNSWRAASINPLQPNADTRVEARLYSQVNEGVSQSGTGGSKLFLSETTPRVAQAAAFPGVIAGAWRGLEEDTMVQAGFPKTIFSPHSKIFMPEGERMTLQLSATSTIAVNSAAVPDIDIAAANTAGAL